VRIRYSSDWNSKPSTELKLEVLKKLNISITTIVKILTDRRNDLEHNYLLPSHDEARLAVESAELWLEKSVQYLPLMIGIGGLPIDRFSVSPSEQIRISMTFAEPK